MQNISLEVTNSLFKGLYLLFDHNALVLAYISGLIICGFISFLRPSRLAFLFTFSFAALAFGYEYDKHIIEPLRTQTLATVIPTPGTHQRAAKLIDLVLSNLLPVFFFIIGWSSLFITIIISIWPKKKESVTVP